jgi:hypothetical protein
MILVAIIIIGCLVLVVLIIPYLPHSYSVQKVTAPNPTPTPLFTVTLSPSSETVVQELDQTVGFKVTIQGNANYPCAIVFHSNNLPDDLLFELGLSSSYTTASLNYTVSGGFVDVEGNTGTYSLYVTVIDSNGNSYNSNEVSVTVK